MTASRSPGGAEHFREAQRLLSRAMNVKSDSDYTPANRDESAHCLAAAQIHATLAHAAAVALTVVVPKLGDSAEVTAWAQVVAPDTMKGSARPSEWPPQHGDTWVDRNGDVWVCQLYEGSINFSSGYLVCVTRKGDDSAEAIWDDHGPLRLLNRPLVQRRFELDCPF